MRYFLQLSFNGKNFHGWQIQQNAHSVQAELNKALKTLLNAGTETTGCGRTDTGVHAAKFFAHFDAVEIKDEVDFVYHLNALLPLEIAVQKLIQVGAAAHARYDAASRTYRYFIHHKKNPFLNDSSYFFPLDVDIDLMNEAAKTLQEYSDFSCFSKTHTQVKTNICKVASAFWRKENEQLIFEITADRFLRNMVRAIVGTMLEVGEKHITITEFKEIIENKKRANAGASVPGHALFLVDVIYPFIK